MKHYRKNALLAGALFLITMGLGMIDAYFVFPRISGSLGDIPAIGNLIHLGAFAVLGMAVGIVGIALALFPVVKVHSESIALTYLSFRVIECVLLLVGPLVYLLLVHIAKQDAELGFVGADVSSVLPAVAVRTKLICYQFAMAILGTGSMFLCYSFYKSLAIPRFLSLWGFVGYALLTVSAVLDLVGFIDTTGLGILFYIPGGLWEIVGFPLWLFMRGFQISAASTTSH